MTPEPLVELRGVTKRFRVQRGWKDLILRPGEPDLRTALEDVTLSVAPGEFYGLLGANGAGKTTLFKILATLILPDSGTVRVNGLNVLEESGAVRRHLVPVIANERSLYWRVSARENLKLYAALHGLKGSQARQRVGEALEIVDLVETGEKQVGLFSSGMKQRLLIARALLGRPEVLLLDEPTRSLDPVSARQFRRFLRDRIGREHGTTVLLATHDHEEVTELCDRVGVLDHGRLLAEGQTDVVLADTRERRYDIRLAAGRSSASKRKVEEIAHPILDRFNGRLVDWTYGPAAEDSGLQLTIQAPLDEESAAELLRELIQAGLPVSGFLRSDLSLADLLERVALLEGTSQKPDARSHP